MTSVVFSILNDSMTLRMRQLLRARSWCGCPVLLHPGHRLPLSRVAASRARPDPGSSWRLGGASLKPAAEQQQPQQRGGAGRQLLLVPTRGPAALPAPPAAAGAAVLGSVPARAARYAAIKEVIMTNGADLFLVRSFSQMTAISAVQGFCHVSEGENRDLPERVSPVRWQPQVLMCCHFMCVCYRVVAECTEGLRRGTNTMVRNAFQKSA